MMGRGWSAPRGVSCTKVLILPDIRRWRLLGLIRIINNSVMRMEIWNHVTGVE